MHEPCSSWRDMDMHEPCRSGSSSSTMACCVMTIPGLRDAVLRGDMHEVITI